MRKRVPGPVRLQTHERVRVIVAGYEIPQGETGTQLFIHTNQLGAIQAINGAAAEVMLDGWKRSVRLPLSHLRTENHTGGRE